jgi:hypothetical protein
MEKLLAGRRIVREYAGHRRQVADVAVDDAKQRADRFERGLFAATGLLLPGMIAF